MAAEATSPHSLSGNLSLTSDYVFRGVSQTGNGPAIQGGFDYEHASGLYIGTWGSNVSWVKEGGFKNNSSMEIDLYGGYRGSLPADIGYDVGAITYYYPGDKVAGIATPDTTEVYASASWEFLTLKYSHVVSKNFIGWVGTGDSRNSNYLELNADYDLGNGWGILGHVGKQKVKNLGVADYTDWKIGVSKDIGFGTIALAYTDTDADTASYTVAGENLADGRAFLSFSKSF
jgi:uncharacterized protein (TIGR02001 family)